MSAGAGASSRMGRDHGAVCAAAALSLAGLLLVSAPGGTASAEEACIATYDRQGRVTGEYCPDGTSKPPPAGRRAARAPDAVDPESTVPSDARGGSGKATGTRAAPKDGKIQCGQWKNQNGTGCRGIFTILR